MSLIVVCSHCLTWVEPHADRCTECGVSVDVDAPDPDAETMAVRLGEPLADLGPARLERRGWPSLGRLIATREGLLFLPDHAPRLNGALEPRPEEPVRSMNWFDWITSGWRRGNSPAVAVMPAKCPGFDLAEQLKVSERLLDAPGGLFIRRSSVRRTLVRWNHLKIERQPNRSVILTPAQHNDTVRQLRNRLREYAEWPHTGERRHVIDPK